MTNPLSSGEASGGSAPYSDVLARLPTLRDKWLAMSREERRAHAKPGARCVERGCEEPAGTPWGPHWCADHDDERMDRISRNLEAMAKEQP